MQHFLKSKQISLQVWKKSINSHVFLYFKAEMSLQMKKKILRMRYPNYHFLHTWLSSIIFIYLHVLFITNCVYFISLQVPSPCLKNSILILELVNLKDVLTCIIYLDGKGDVNRLSPVEPWNGWIKTQNDMTWGIQVIYLTLLAIILMGKKRYHLI